jgi:hypothetical protein
MLFDPVLLCLNSAIIYNIELVISDFWILNFHVYVTVGERCTSSNLLSFNRLSGAVAFCWPYIVTVTNLWTVQIHLLSNNLASVYILIYMLC